METGGCVVTQVNGILLYNGKTYEEFTRDGGLTKTWHAYNAACVFFGKPELVTNDKFKGRRLCLFY